MTERVPRSLLWPIVIACLGFELSIWNLDARGIWLDEIIYLRLERQDPATIAHSLSYKFTDHHPPAYHIAAHYWLKLAGETDFSVRLLSVFLGVLSLALVYQIGRCLANAQLGQIAMLLMSASPLAIMFTRLARYYALTTTLGLLSTLLFLRLLDSPNRRKWIAYIVSSALLSYTDYFGLSLLLSHGILALAANRQIRSFFRSWLISQVMTAILFLPWVPSFVMQATSASEWSPADLAFSLSGYVLKLMYPLYAFSIGTTLFPWEPVAIAGCIALSILGALGLVFMARRTHRWGPGVLSLVAFLGIPFALVYLAVSFITPLVPIVAIPDHMVFVVPFFCLLFAAGWLQLRRRSLQLVLGLVVLLTYTVSFSNYLTGTNFHNPVYAVPIEQVVDLVMQNAQPGDIIASKKDTGFEYHYGKRESTVPYYEVAPELYSVVDQLDPPRIWVISFGRDRTRAGDDTPMFVQSLLEQGYSLTLIQGYV